MDQHLAIARLSAIPDGLDRLATGIEIAKSSTFFYKRLLRKHFRDGISRDELIEKFAGLPFTSKEDVVRNYPDGFLAVEPRDVALYCESTGTSGNTLGSTKGASYYTESDLQRDCERRFSPDLQVGPDDIVANALPFALTSSGICFHMAARQRGAAVINLDGGSLLSSPTKHIEITAELKATILICSLPTLYSTLLAMQGETAQTRFDSLRAIQLCGLPTLANGKRKIADIFGVPVFDTYGLSEFGATTFTCAHGHMHVHENDFLIEIIDPRTGSNVADGAGGEIVVTTLSRQGSPKIRYRTADFGIMSYAPCSCGRAEPRLIVKGRLRDAAQFGERFRLPIDFEEIIHSFPETTGLYRLNYSPAQPADSREPPVDTVTAAKVVVDVDSPGNDLKQRMEAKLRAEFGPHVELELTRPGGATPGLVGQEIYSSVRTVKAATFEDGRPLEWLVTY